MKANISLKEPLLTYLGMVCLKKDNHANSETSSKIYFFCCLYPQLILLSYCIHLTCCYFVCKVKKNNRNLQEKEQKKMQLSTLLESCIFYIYVFTLSFSGLSIS